MTADNPLLARMTVLLSGFVQCRPCGRRITLSYRSRSKLQAPFAGIRRRARPFALAARARRVYNHGEPQEQPMDIEKKRGRILWITKYNGGFVAVVGVLCLLCSLFGSTWRDDSAWRSLGPATWN